ncbi:golgin subfamily B member 1-like isoform X4 [Vigna umbellata]|uniref:golgin subfamily B member 1-like isoform X4 n=1 Tax=Vigna umbellata TaxID=87088 RepID=UPI001F5FF1D4|nr:golgin subfamily B member 1-like isoform X4 [Vigna umbellata]
MPIDEAQQPIANAVSVRSKALEESSQEIPPKAYVKSNKEVKTPESVSNEVVEISTTNYTEKQEVPKAHVGEGERIGDKFNQEKEEGIESTNIQEEEVRITSSTLVSVKGDTNQIPQQETLHVNESEVIENAIVVQEWEVFETKDNAGTIIENLDEDASEIRGKDGTDAKQFTDLEMSKSETEEEIQDNRKFNQREEEKKIDEVTGMQTPQEEVHTTSPTPAFVKSHTDITQQEKAFHLNESNVILTAKQSCIPEFEHDRNPTVQEIEVFETKHNVNRVMENLDKEETEIRENEKTDTTQLNEESGQQDKQLEADITDQSNKKVQTPEYVTEENVEINITDYAEEKNQNPTDHAKENEGIEDIFKQEEKEKLIEETTNTQSEEEEVQTHAPAFVIGDTNQIPHQETMHADESKVMDNAKQSYIPEIELDGKAIVFQETEVSESLYKKDATEIRVKKEIDAKKLTDSEMPKPEIEEDEALKPIANAELVRTEAVEESGKQETQPKEDITEETADESNKEVLVKKFVITEETAEINTNNCTKEHDTVKTSPAKELEGTGDGAKLHEEEANGIEENIKTQNPEEEFQTSSPTPAFVQGDSGQTLQQETVNIDESEVLDNDKHRSIPEIELDGKSTVVQETNNPEIEDNISTGAEDLDNKDAIEVQAEEGAYVKQLTNVEIPNSEVKGVPKDEALQLKANIVLNVTEAIDEGSQQVIQPQADVTQKSNKDVKTPEYVTAETIEINTTNYTKEQEKVPSIHAEVEGIKNKFNHKEEAKGIEETTKLQSLDEIQTKSPTSIFVQGDKNQVPIQETLPIDASKVIDSAKQSCIPEIKLDENSTVAQETEKPETKNIVNIITKNFDEKDASEIRAEEGSYDKQVTEVERSNSLAEEYEPIAITVAVGTETVDDSNQEKIQFEEDVAEKKSSKEEQTPHYCDEDTTEINTNNYADEHDKDQTSHAKVKEGIANEKNLDQTENAKGIDKTSKMKIPEEEIQTRSTTPTIVQDDTDQISQKELLHVVESGVIDNIKQSCTPEMQFDRKSTIVQETENPETEDNVGIITENIGTNNARKIIAEEATDSKKLADFKMHDPEMKGVQDNEAPQPVAIATAVKTETVDDSNKEQIQLEDIIEKKSNKEEQTLQDVAKDTVKINTNNYTNEHDKVQKSHAEVKEGIGDDENFDQDEETKDIEETRKMQLAEQKVQKRSLTPAFVQGDTDQISQKELLHNVESDIIHYDKHICIPEIEPDRKSTIVQETEKTDTEENISKETKNLGTNYAGEISAKEEIDVKKLVDLKIPKSEIQVVPEDEVRQSIATAVAVLTKTVDDSKLEQIQLDEDITEKKSNKEKQTPQFVAKDAAEINTTSYTEEHDKVKKSNVEVKQGIEEDENFGQGEEPKATGETKKMQLPKENVQTISPTPAYVQCDTDQTLKQQLLHIDELEVIDYAKQSCMPEIEVDRKSTIAQETEKPDTKDNISDVTDNLGTTNGSEIRAEEETDVKKLADLKILESEIEVVVRAQSVDDSNQEQIQLEDITEKNSNKGEQTTQNVAGDTAEININSYTDEHDKVQTSDAEVRERSEDDENFGQQEECKGIKETCKMQLPEKEVRTRSPTPSFVQGNIDQISQQEPLHVDKSEVIDYMKQSSHTEPEIQLDKKSTMVQFNQGTEKPETKDNVGIATDKLGTSDPSKIRAEKRTDAKKSTDFMMPKPEIKDKEVPEDEVPQPIEVAVAVETVDDINQKEIPIEEDITEKKSNKDEQSSQYVAKDTTEIKTNIYIDEHDKVQTSHAEVNQGTEDDENFGQVEEAKGIEETNKVQLPEEEVQIRSPTPAFVQGDTDQISQQELLLVDESEVIDYVEQSCIPEIELDRKSTIVQETEKPETKNNVSIVTENLGTNDASEIIAKEETDAEKLADVKIVKSEIKGAPKDETLKPIANAVLLRTEAVEKSSQQDKQQEAEVSDKSIKEVQSQEYITEGSVEININNEAEEKDKNSTSNAEKEGTSHAEEKEGIEDIFNQKEKEKEIEEATKTHSVEEEEIQRRSPPPGFVQGDTNQILHQETLHINESEVIHNAKLSYIPEIELHEKAIVVQKSEKVETKDNFDKVRENLNKDESENRAEEGIDVNQLTDLEMPKSETKAGVLEDDSLQPMPDTVSVEKGAVSVSQEKRQPQEEFIKKVNKEVQTPQYFTEDREKIEITNDTEEQEEVSTSQPKEKSGNNDDDKFEQEEKKGIEESTKTQLQDKDISTTIGEPEDKALITRLNSSSNGNEGLDESSPEKFTENLNKDVQTPQCNTKVNAETNITSYPDKLEEAEDIEESIEKQLAEEEIQHTLPTPTSVQEDIDQMSQQQTLHDDEIEVINNAKSCMTEIELDRKSIVVEESKQPETKANADLVKEEQADHQSEESSVQSFITNYIIVERHTTSESNKELSDDVDLDGQKKVESHLEEFLEIKDASEIRAKGIHSKQLTDVEIQKSETEGVAEDKGMQTMSSTSVKNYAFDECCQEEIQPREEYAETHIKEVKMPHYEFNMQKHIPEVDGVEEDTCQIRVVNEQKLESQLASLNKETTFIDNRYSDGEIENINAISDIEKEVNPKSHTKQKLVIHDSIFNEEEAKGIEEMTKIKLLNSATDCSPEEVQPKLPDPATIQGDTDQILQQQTLSSDALDTIDNNLRSFPENELDRMSTSVEEPETKANINIVEEQSDKQSHEPSMQSLITDYITAEGHLASENSSKLSYDKKEQKTVNLQMVENLGIKYASKTTTEEVTDTKQPTGVELEKTKNEELIENKTLDESNQEEMQPEEDFSETYTKGKKTPQSSMENVNSEGMEITENSSKSSYAEEEQEQVINTYTIENSEIKDSRRVKLEEASYIKEATDESVDKAISFLSTIPSVRIGIVDESIQEKIQKDVQPAVINSKAEQRPENDFVRNMEVLEGPGNTSVENDEKVEVQSEANNQKTIKKHPNLEELETAEISPSSDTKELGKEREVAKLGGVSESVSVDITEHIDTGKLETQEAETGISGNTKEVKAGEEFEKISLSSSVGVISRDSQDSGTKVLHKKSHGILSGVGSKVKHSISKVKKVITGKSSHPKTPPS